VQAVGSVWHRPASKMMYRHLTTSGARVTVHCGVLMCDPSTPRNSCLVSTSFFLVFDYLPVLSIGVPRSTQGFARLTLIMLVWGGVELKVKRV